MTSRAEVSPVSSTVKETVTEARCPGLRRGRFDGYSGSLHALATFCGLTSAWASKIVGGVGEGDGEAGRGVGEGPWATAVGVGAVWLSFAADLQMYRFAATKQPGEVMDRGLWAWSRHPNYFGEFAFWVSLALFGLAASPGDWWWLFVGAAAMLAMFEGASIPMMEQRSLERRPSYQDVIDRVPRFVPRPPR